MEKIILKNYKKPRGLSPTMGSPAQESYSGKMSP